MSLKQAVSRNVKKLRKAAGLTQGDVASRAGLNPAYVARLEAKPQNVTLDVLERLTKALKCAPADLIASQSKVRLPKGMELADLDEAIRLVERSSQAADILRAFKDRIED